MKTWHELVWEKLDLPWLLATPSQAVPFGLISAQPVHWRAGRLEAIGESQWLLSAGSAEGLEAEYHLLFFHDTRALECWGEIVNLGRQPVRGVRESLSLDLELELPPDFGQPWVRSVNGVRLPPHYFPPYDFAVVDRQLLRSSQMFPLTLAGAEDGRTSGEDLPCAILCSEGRTHGLAFSLEWSGLWRITFRPEPQRPGSLRLQVGLRGLNLDLQPGQRLPLPRLLIAAFDGDLEAGGNSLRRHIRRHVTPKLGGQEVLPPTSFNHWFAFENDFSAEMLRPVVEACSAAGMEYFCVDAGWFAGGFRQGIGNWERVERAKFPEGVGPFAEFVRSRAMKYGAWFEPEWAHQESDLYRQHPDWFWPTPAETPWPEDPLWASFDPDCHLLNLGLAEVRQWWLELLMRAYQEWGLRWIRWDFNQMPRPNWENGVAAGQVGWRQIEHVTGLYRLLDQLIEACPDLLIEQCAGGGHRIDLGTVRRGHTFWMNDHTVHSDIVRALQHGLNVVLPGNYPNTNLCQARHNFTDYDFLSHGAGGFGYSGRIWEAPPEDFARLAKAIARFKGYRRLLLGDYHRPTGQPERADGYAKVVFSDGGESVTMDFNPEGGPGQARFAQRS